MKKSTWYSLVEKTHQAFDERCGISSGSLASFVELHPCWYYRFHPNQSKGVEEAPYSYLQLPETSLLLRMPPISVRGTTVNFLSLRPFFIVTK
ncbi:hypothetical protein SRHO_G00080510 [Serrasalmus rhombeus]